MKPGWNRAYVGKEQGGEAAASLHPPKLWRAGVLGAYLENPAVRVTMRVAPYLLPCRSWERPSRCWAGHEGKG